MLRHLVVGAVQIRFLAASTIDTGTRIIGNDELRNTWEKFEGPHVGLDPVVEILIRCGVGKGVVGSAQYRHKHRSRFRCTGLCQRQRNPGSGPVDKQFFARPVFLPPDHILSLLSATVEIAKRL